MTNKEEYSYFVDNTEYTTHERCITGMYIKAKIPGFDHDYLLFIKNKDMPDTLFRDQDTIDIFSTNPSFYTCPRGTFGG